MKTKEINKEAMTPTKGSIVDNLRKLEPEQVLRFPIEKTATIRSLASTYGLLWNKVFKTKVDRQNRTIAIIRTK